jgi:hypothetical protein
MQAVGCILFLVLGIAQLVAGWVGADYYVGPFWTGVIFLVCLLGRFALPITIFGFLGAMHVWEWPWWGALLFTFPGLLIAIPSMLSGVLEAIGAKRNARD